ncbi:Rieske 2Fe-2S domain-containing protein [Streptomyces sp. TRM 70351]|uniref:Rieske 2Fe-2S domain-containing protein n=1 Tax=Streptomyces sp. TRM 70351 TaxID=3116552 RepID=UPI002E7B2070|nr:Rieske 2Fe-2S domain-containing protein [Streptomyces sp. TRM 70351]MEE1930752.1 Rieske 2Fe-2S domain-containing protein [Streptomyces sp. TRM 70351]
MATDDAYGKAVRSVRRVLPGQGPGRVLSAVDRLEHDTRLDAAAAPLRDWIGKLPLGGARDALHGRWLGHPLHPLMVQLPVGAWLSAAALDVLPGHRRGARALVALGLAGAGPAAVAGWVDWAELRPRQQRVGLVHAVGNVAAVGLYAGSFAARCAGRHGLGRALGFAGLTAVGASGALGGHLAYRQSAGANHAEGLAARAGGDWHDLGELGDFPVGEAVLRRAGEVAVVVVRESEETVRVLVEQCSHLGGPLSQGEVVDGCLQCPWHGSRFRLEDGWNVQGPATAPQPAFETRIEDGRVQARLRD